MVPDSSKTATPLRRRFPTGTEIVRQGETGNRAWLIEAGAVEILIEQNGAMRPVALVGRHAVVGEMALIDHGPRTATVRVIEDVTALEIDRSAFDQMLNRAEPLIPYLFESLLGIVRRAYHLPVPERAKGGSNYRSTSANDRVLKRDVAEAGRYFYRAGDQPATAFLIQSGAVSLLRPDFGVTPTEIARLGPGRVFGAMHLIDHKPQPLSAIAAEQTVYERISEQQVMEAIGRLPAIMQGLLRSYARLARDQIERI